MRTIDTTNQKKLLLIQLKSFRFSLGQIYFITLYMITRITTGERFKARKEAKGRVGGKWAFERLVNIGEIIFVKDSNSIASDGLHNSKQGNRNLS